MKTASKWLLVSALLGNAYGCWEEPQAVDDAGTEPLDESDAGASPGEPDKTSDAGAPPKDAGEILPPDEEEEEEDTPISPAPDALVGNWKFGIISFTNFWGSQGQYIGNGGGTSVRFSFRADGHYTQQVYISRRNYACLMETWTETVGTATFDADSFTIYPSRGRYKASDTCLDRNNFDRPMTDEEREDFIKTFLWRFEVNPNNGKTYLMLGFDPDTWSSFEPDYD